MSGSTGSSLTPQGSEAAEHDSASAAAATPTHVIYGSTREQQSPSLPPCECVCTSASPGTEPSQTLLPVANFTSITLKSGGDTINSSRSYVHLS